MIALLLAGAALGAKNKPPPPSAVPFDAGVVAGLQARNIGSAEMSGRIAAIAARADASGQMTLFVGAASGGVWKSVDSGTTFRPVFDDQPVQSIGAIALDPSNPQRVWVGTGEAWTRNSVSYGNGVYRSDDGGETWTWMGLPASERVARIVVDPRSSDRVWVCVPGRLWSDSTERGVYHTEDGGTTWTLALKGENASTGCADLALDPKNPDVVLAALWDFRRQGWTFRSGGPGPTAPSGSGLYRSADGGKTWVEQNAQANPGFPQEPFGRIAVAFAPSDPNRIYAFVESPKSALYVSEDAGRTWERRDDSQWMVWRPFYFARLIVDPTNPDRVFKTDGAMIRSDDAGKSFGVVGGFGGMHGDVHDVWIDPDRPSRVVAGDDGGLFVSGDGGNQWWKAYNLPISQFYHVTVDTQDPYHVYGGLQDNGSWVAPSEHPGGITNADWIPTCWGDGFWSFADPTSPDHVYCESQGGYAYRLDLRTREMREIQPKAGPHEKLRYNWNTPLLPSPVDPNTLYIGAQFLFRSRDHGQTWERISPDLTTNDPAKQRQEQSGGVTVDNSAAEMHTTIVSVSESPVAAGTIWVGTDDGNVQLTKDAGKTWTNLTKNVTGLPPASWVSWVEASPHDAATAFATFDRHTYGDFAPYVYVTTDAGAHWTQLLGPKAPGGVEGWAHVVKQDPKDPDLLFLGTELGLWISIDRGAHWARYTGSDFPAVAVRDLAVQPDRDALVLATHGRGIWILDDLRPLRALAPAELEKDVALLVAPGEQRMDGFSWRVTGGASFTGENPADGAVITWYQRTRHLFGKLTVEVLDAQGKVLASLPASTHRGLNRVVWSTRMPPPSVPPAASVAGNATTGIRVLPGTYTVRLTKNGQVSEAPLEVRGDRRAKWTDADRKARYDAAMAIYDLFREETALYLRIAALRESVEERGEAAKGLLDPLDTKLDGLRKQISATTEGGAITGEERLREHTDDVYGAILSWEGPPAATQLDRISALRTELDELKAAFETVLTVDVPAANAALAAKQLEALPIPPVPEVGEEETSGGPAPPPWERDEAVEEPPQGPSWGFRPYF